MMSVYTTHLFLGAMSTLAIDSGMALGCKGEVLDLSFCSFIVAKLST